ncbi:hypothetical protein PR048_029904 [Dryococelus australis]|uniref:HAT C-terminal dimerisation domain-containing protein n=1 Tax=Dryococelus australis TaxID=614101 RepID=A0ABQ9G7G3_9NEOP|nr:hypothetical protein PR048_029904 [Dryococelus australis]
MVSKVYISTAVELIAKIKSFLEHIQSDKGFEETMAETLDIEPQFPAELPIRPREIKLQFDYESHNGSTDNVDPKKPFNRNFFFYTLDCTITSLDEQFDQLKAHYDIFGFLYNIKRQKKDGLLQKCKDLRLALSYKGHLLHSLCDAAKSLNGPLEVLKYIFTNSLCENFPNLTVALRILLTLPMTVATGEKSFSKLKIIKNYLRCTMSQECLVGLATMSIEDDVLQEIDTDTIIKDFADKKACKVH